jgi:hypothetical protein
MMVPEFRSSSSLRPVPSLVVGGGERFEEWSGPSKDHVRDPHTGDSYERDHRGDWIDDRTREKWTNNSDGTQTSHQTGEVREHTTGLYGQHKTKQLKPPRSGMGAPRGGGVSAPIPITGCFWLLLFAAVFAVCGVVVVLNYAADVLIEEPARSRESARQLQQRRDDWESTKASWQVCDSYQRSMSGGWVGVVLRKDEAGRCRIVSTFYHREGTLGGAGSTVSVSRPGDMYLPDRDPVSETLQIPDGEEVLGLFTSESEDDKKAREYEFLVQDSSLGHGVVTSAGFRWRWAGQSQQARVCATGNATTRVEYTDDQGDPVRGAPPHGEMLLVLSCPGEDEQRFDGWSGDEYRDPRALDPSSATTRARR